MKILKLNKDGIHEYQQNRYPYLLIDEAEEVIPGVSAKGYKDLKEDEWFFKVHWPSDPNMPGMLQIESLVQMCALSLLTMPGNKGKLVYLISADKIKLKRKIVPNDRLLIDDGRIVLGVLSIDNYIIDCEVITGGELTNSKGINLQGGGLSADALTNKDIEDMKHAAKIKVDFVAISFPRDAKDIKKARKMMKDCNCNAQIIAKIERADALNHIEEIIKESDVIMIARGDLGVEVGDAALPPIQKSLIKKARDMDRAVITATQMMESMIENKIPTRAEVFDVANAVIDGTDAVMLSGETSIGHYPDEAVKSMSRICEVAEKQRSVRESDHRINQRFETISEAVAMSSMYSANHIGAKAICSLTETGGTCLWMSRISSGIPIYAFTRHTATRRRVALYRGVYPMKFDITHTDPLEANKQMIDQLIEQNVVVEGDFVIITKGDLRGKRGATNNMKIIQVGQALEHTL